MVFLLAMLAVQTASAPPQDQGVHVPRAALDCYLRRARSARRAARSAQDLFYLDLRTCPPVNVIRATQRLGSFPDLRRRTPPLNLFPDFRGMTRNGAPVDRVIVVTGSELDCLADPRKLRRVRSPAWGGRYRLAFDRCR